MLPSLKILKSHGISPPHIFDLGSCDGNWTKLALQVFPTSKYYMIDAITYKNTQKILNEFPNVKQFEALLYSNSSVQLWYSLANTGDSIFCERSTPYSTVTPKPRHTKTLDTLIEENISEKLNDVFIKIDCQGSELPILRGAKKLLTNTSFILAEIPLFGQYNTGVPTFQEHIAEIAEMGFIPFLFVEQHIIENFAVQIDMIFIAKSHQLNKTIAGMKLPL